MTLPSSPGPASETREDARERLVAAGLELFGEHGFAEVTTRALAARAGVNQAAIPYYFGGKEGVYLAVAAHVGELLGRLVEPVLARVEARFAAHPARATAALLLPEFLGGVARAVWSNPPPRSAFAFILVEQQHPTAALELLEQALLLPVHRCAARLVAPLVGQEEGAREVILLAHALVGILTAFTSGRVTLARCLGAPHPIEAELAEGAVETVETLARAMVAGLCHPPAG